MLAVDAYLGNAASWPTSGSRYFDRPEPPRALRSPPIATTSVFTLRCPVRTAA